MGLCKRLLSKKGTNDTIHSASCHLTGPLVDMLNASAAVLVIDIAKCAGVKPEVDNPAHQIDFGMKDRAARLKNTPIHIFTRNDRVSELSEKGPLLPVLYL